MEFAIQEPSSGEESCDVTDIRCWYSIFKKHSIKTKIRPLPDSFASYLSEDGIVLPERVGRDALGRDMLSDEDEEGGAGGAEGPLPDAFEDIDLHLESTLTEFGGKIMVKVNDKAPTDALWINCGSLACNSLSSVYMMLKASEKVGMNLKETGNYLVIRKWANMFPSMEFRVFISESTIIGISQKDVSTFYPFLHADSGRIHGVVQEFFDNKVRTSLPAPTVVMDIYVDKQDRVWIVGLSPFGDTSETDSLLFTWDELMSRGSSCLSESSALDVFRVVKNESSVLPRDSTVGASRGPSDFNLISGDIFSRNSKLLRGNDTSNSSDDSDSEV